MTMLWLTDIRLPAEASGVRDARRLVDSLTLAVTPEQRDDLRLLVSEVTTNAIRHGRPAEPGVAPVVRIRLGVQAGRLRAEVHDRGRGFHPRPRTDRARLDSGWGVHFVHTLADRWGSGYGDHGAWVVWFEFVLAPDGDLRRPATDRWTARGGVRTDAAPVRRLGRSHRGGDDGLARTG